MVELKMAKALLRNFNLSNYIMFLNQSCPLMDRESEQYESHFIIYPCTKDRDRS